MDKLKGIVLFTVIVIMAVGAFADHSFEIYKRRAFTNNMSLENLSDSLIIYYASRPSAPVVDYKTAKQLPVGWVSLSEDGGTAIYFPNNDSVGIVIYNHKRLEKKE